MKNTIMRSLSLKIFFWFWSAVIVTMVASAMVTAFLPSQTFFIQARDYFSFNLRTTGKIGAGMYENNDLNGLDELLGTIEEISSFYLYLLNDQGEPLRAAGLPSGAKSFALQALSSSTVQFEDLATHPLMAVKVESESGRQYVAMLELPMGAVQYFLTLTHGHIFRLLAALSASGLICLLLARYLTSPIKKLQVAVRRFAQGDLGVRVTQKIGRRKDEIANLGRDFDAMAAQIEKLMNAHESLLRDVAHELRSPLTRLNVALEITRKHTGHEAQRFIDRIGLETNNLNQLITQLLTLSRLDNADLPIQKKSVVLEEIIARIVQDANFEGQSRGCSVQFSHEDECTLNADGNLVRSAVENVVRNALRYTPDGTQVEITQKAIQEDNQSFVEISVRDFGPGVDEEIIDHLFEPFFRAAHPKDSAVGGTGLGLAIAQRAITLHQGDISAINGEDGGLIVKMRLPIS